MAGRVEAAVGLCQPILEGHANKLQAESDGIGCVGKDAERLGGLGETESQGRPGRPPECTSSCLFMVLVGYKLIKFKLTKDWKVKQERR